MAVGEKYTRSISCLLTSRCLFSKQNWQTRTEIGALPWERVWTAQCDMCTTGSRPFPRLRVCEFPSTLRMGNVHFDGRAGISGDDSVKLSRDETASGSFDIFSPLLYLFDWRCRHRIKSMMILSAWAAPRLKRASGNQLPSTLVWSISWMVLFWLAVWAISWVRTIHRNMAGVKLSIFHFSLQMRPLTEAWGPPRMPGIVTPAGGDLRAWGSKESRTDVLQISQDKGRVSVRY